jgi:hypothetical protein
LFQACGSAALRKADRRQKVQPGRMNPVVERVEIVAAWSNVFNPPRPTRLLPKIQKYSYVVINAYPNGMFPDLLFVIDNRRLFGSIHGATGSLVERIHFSSFVHVT